MSLGDRRAKQEGYCDLGARTSAAQLSEDPV